MPATTLDSQDYKKRLRFDELKSTRLEALCKWKQKDVKGIKKNAYIKEIQRKNSKILSVGEKNQLEKLEVYTDRFPLLLARKQLNRIRIYLHLIAKEIMNNSIFNGLSMTIILANSGTMAFNPTPPDQEATDFYWYAERLFVYFYILEMSIKIAGSGFYFGGENTYLKDNWNILDFVIVCFSFLDIYQDLADESTTAEVYDIDTENSFSLTSLRVVRVLRPLKTISSIKGLKVLVNALFSALPLLRDTLVILVFFYICLAIAGL